GTGGVCLYCRFCTVLDRRLRGEGLCGVCRWVVFFVGVRVCCIAFTEGFYLISWFLSLPPISRFLPGRETPPEQAGRLIICDFVRGFNPIVIVRSFCSHPVFVMRALGSGVVPAAPRRKRQMSPHDLARQSAALLRSVWLALPCKVLQDLLCGLLYNAIDEQSRHARLQLDVMPHLCRRLC